MENSTHYQGVLNSQVRIQLTDLVQTVAKANMGDQKNMKKLCSIALELLDNAQRYCSSGQISFTWKVSGDQLVISLQNLATQVDAERMLRAVEAVNRMSQEEIDVAFRTQLTNGEFGDKGGAGLGFLDIARKTKGLIQAAIDPANGNEYNCRSLVTTQLK